MTKRQAAVAGSFYEGDSATLRRQVNALLVKSEPRKHSTIKALIVPHAGYIYSGTTAAEAYRLLQATDRPLSRVVLLGPAHRVYLKGLAVPSADHFSTPLGDIPLDREYIEQALSLPGVSVSDRAHELEHSLEVQLPFLQQVLDEFTLVPIVVGNSPAAQVADVIDALWGGPDTLIIISSDLSHFQDYPAAQEHDNRTCARIVAGDCHLEGTDACGAAALNGFLLSEHGRKLQRELLDCRNSGDSSGDRHRVVGYGAFALY